MELTFEMFPGRTLSLFLYRDVSFGTIASLRSQLSSRTLEVALLNPRLVASPLCIRAAANKALLAQSTGAKVSQSLHSDFIRCLHSGKNIGESLRVLGPSMESKGGDLMIAAFDVLKEEGASGGGGGGCSLSALRALVSDGKLESVEQYF